MKKLTQEQKQQLYSIADRYCTSKPVSGSWDTEAEHELNAICKEMRLGRKSAKEIMKKYLGFTDRMFNNEEDEDLEEAKMKESNPITVDLPEDLDDFLHDIVQEYPHSLSYGNLIRHKYTEDDITDLYEIMTTCEEKDYDVDFIEDVAVPVIERIFFGPEPNPEDYEPTYEGYLKYCRDTNGEPRSKEEWTKITGLTEAYEDNDDRKNFPYFVTVKDLTEDCSEIDSFFDILPDILQDELVFPGQVIYEYKDPRTARIFFKDKQAAINFASNIDRSIFEVRFYTRINKVQEKKNEASRKGFKGVLEFVNAYCDEYDHNFSAAAKEKLANSILDFCEEYGYSTRNPDHLDVVIRKYLENPEDFENLLESKKLKESNLITVDFACGPGFITEEHTNDYDSYELEETIYDAGTASSIEDMAQSKDWSENLAEYYDGDGVDSIYFKGMMEINHGYYMVWQVTYDPELASEEQIKDYLTGQMSDGWGEGFEQHSFGEDIEDEEVELEDEDDEGNTFYYNDTVNTRIEYFYSPWNNRNFEVINLNEEM